MEKVYTTEEVAGMLKVSVITIRRYIKSKRLKASKIGKYYRIRESDIENLLNKTRTK